MYPELHSLSLERADNGEPHGSNRDAQATVVPDADSAVVMLLRPSSSSRCVTAVGVSTVLVCDGPVTAIGVPTAFSAYTVLGCAVVVVSDVKMLELPS